MSLEPLGVWIEEEEDDEGKGEDVGIEEEHDAAAEEDAAAVISLSFLLGVSAAFWTEAATTTQPWCPSCARSRQTS